MADLAGPRLCASPAFARHEWFRGNRSHITVIILVFNLRVLRVLWPLRAKNGLTQRRRGRGEGHNQFPTPFASSEDEMAGGGVRMMGVSTALDTNGKGAIKLGDAGGY